MVHWSRVSYNKLYRYIQATCTSSILLQYHQYDTIILREGLRSANYYVCRSRTCVNRTMAQLIISYTPVHEIQRVILLRILCRIFGLSLSLSIHIYLSRKDTVVRKVHWEKRDLDYILHEEQVLNSIHLGVYIWDGLCTAEHSYIRQCIEHQLALGYVNNEVHKCTRTVYYKFRGIHSNIIQSRGQRYTCIYVCVRVCVCMRASGERMYRWGMLLVRILRRRESPFCCPFFSLFVRFFSTSFSLALFTDAHASCKYPLASRLVRFKVDHHNRHGKYVEYLLP